MNWQRGQHPIDPPPGTPLEQARWLFNHPTDGSYGDGPRLVELVLAGRDWGELSSEELELLALGYNWWGKHEESFKVAKLSLSRAAHNLKLFRSIRIYALSAFGHNLPSFITACDECITEGIQPIAFWHLLKADHYIDCAKGNWDLKSDRYWSEGEPMVYPELLGCAVESIRVTLAAQPGLREDESVRGWVGEWDLRFADVLEMLDPEELGGQSPSSVPVRVPEAKHDSGDGGFNGSHSGFGG